MGIFSGVVVFLLVWWTALFTVLPFGHRRDEDGTPVAPNMKKKLVWTTVISVVIWVVIYILIDSDVISFREIANHMIEEDLKR